MHYLVYVLDMTAQSSKSNTPPSLTAFISSCEHHRNTPWDDHVAVVIFLIALCPNVFGFSILINHVMHHGHTVKHLINPHRQWGSN